MNKDPDERLVRACRNGDPVAFGTLLTRYERPVYNVAMRMLRHPDDARDVTQTTFLKVFEKLDQFDFEHKFYSWIYRIAINEAINLLNGRQRYAPLDDDDAGVDEGCSPHEAYGDAQRSNRVQAAMMKLSDDHRAVMTLRHFAECSYHDIAEILGIPEKTVKSRLFTARQALREHLEADGVGDA
jgi:RNA polymerase sigma-70 factor (ECF subfamily)